MPQRAITRNVAANVLNAGTSIGAAAISVPLVIHYVGLSGFGVWTLAQTVLLYLATAETGFGPAVQRYVSVAHGAQDRFAAARVIWSASRFYTALGAVVGVLVALLAPAIVSLFKVSPALHDQAVAMFRITGIAMPLALVAAGLANVLQGLERFTGAALATGISALAFLVVAAILLADGRGLEGLAIAVVVQHAVGVTVRGWLVRDVLLAAPWAKVSRAEARDLIGFSARIQVGVLSTLINSQTDKIVVGLVATTAAIGEVGIGSQVAEASRFVAAAALGPVLARLAVIHGSGDVPMLNALYHRAEFIWTRLSLGLIVVACCVMQPLIEAWLGGNTGNAALYGVLLTIGYGINMSAGPAIAYLRAIGQPGLEARYGALTIGGNVVLTVALGIAFGPTGVVSATTIAYLGGTVWFLWRARRVLPERGEPMRPPLIRALLTAPIAGALALGWGLLMVDLFPRVVALVGVAAGAGLALGIFVAGATGVRLSVAGLRGLIIPAGSTIADP